MSDFLKLADESDLTLGVVGLGYVGLPLAVEFASAGFKVYGFEIDSRKVELLSRGENYVDDVDDALLERVISLGKLVPVSDFSLISECDAISICVPTPLSKTQEPDIGNILSATDEVAKYLKPGALVVLESTTYPGTTMEVLLPALSKGGREVGRDFFLAFSPERVDPGNTEYFTRNTPKVIGGVTGECLERAGRLYRSIITEIVPVSSTTAAEMVKLVENTFRAVNIASVNEIAQVCHRLGLDVWEVTDAAATKPFGFVPFYPGPGLGGHCIPIDPLYLSWKMRSLDFKTRIIELASEINQAMPAWVVSRIADLLNDDSKCIRGSTILILGAAYKRGADDVRESPALEVMERLIELGADVAYSDPHVPNCAIGKHWDQSVELESVELTRERLEAADLVVCTTDHPTFDWDFILTHSKKVFDTRNATKGFESEKVTKL